MQNYNTITKVKKLINLGDISFISEKIGHKHTFDYNKLTEEQKTWTMAYHRDRGEPLKIHKTTSIYLLKLNAERSWVEYIYLFVNNKWEQIIV